ncbi:enhanced serine sensitivity protein SseB [Pseudoxanthomonas sangjuensis]|uniref:SseB family protein n=1 Tax=Pseudoxanthomonas sangjuensis TaxID=1503750 RepID=UPI00139101D2|nr:SseB family protein [Pseudoxanthomonas sangjuensis]KAF1713587.1 hypothetical protein CSC71_06830 [Pseudoxanthomonas sangjuensis]
MIPADELARLMHQALSDKSAEPAFFRALLDATVYAHTPRNGRSGRLCFIQFTTPDGLTVLPFFTEESQARIAAGSAATVVVLAGRQLFEWTRGATLMLNPNDVSCTLYPEEIAALLDHGEVAIVERVDTGSQQLWVGPASQRPAWLVDRLIALYAGLDCVAAAYLADIGAPEGSEQPGLLVAVSVPSKDAERVARATTTELQPHCQALRTSVDMTAFEPGDLPGWLKDASLEPFYVRAMGERIRLGPQGLQ